LEGIMPNRSLLSVILLSMLLVVGFWVWQGVEDRAPVLGALALASPAVVGASWYRRIQTERRWRTAWNAYAEWDLAQHISH
jgi:hypothetical protein